MTESNGSQDIHQLVADTFSKELAVSGTEARDVTRRVVRMQQGDDAVGEKARDQHQKKDSRYSVINTRGKTKAESRNKAKVRVRIKSETI